MTTNEKVLMLRKKVLIAIAAAVLALGGIGAAYARAHRTADQGNQGGDAGD